MIVTNGSGRETAHLPSSSRKEGAAMADDRFRVSEKKINGRTFRVEPMLAMRAIVMQARLFRLAGPAIERLPEILRGVGPNRSDGEREEANAHAVQAFADIFSKTDPEELAGMVKELAELAEVKRPSGSYERVDFDGDFTGNGGDIIPVVVWVAQEQFGDFFSGLLATGSQNISGRA
jgi:hypothetical protein